jgi:ATP-dependent exoDNAse (exonuclease V) beta subunit
MNDALTGDAAARDAALDVGRSFIVQAPAGSGKTGLLIQRYLALLAGVTQPEAIVAMTFTRKAAAEIRERIIAALHAAANEPEPLADGHEATTWRLAKRALARDATLEWNLQTHPARLRIMTIDALCTGLLRQAPLSTRQGAHPHMMERAESLHVQAAQEELRDPGHNAAAWQQMLAHLDNDASRAVDLMAEMLGRREQWLRLVVGADAVLLRASLERAIAVEIERELAKLRAIFPRETIVELLHHARYAAANLSVDAPSHPLRAVADAESLPPALPPSLLLWQALADWLLTGGDAFRVQVGGEQGFPAKSAATGFESAQRAQRKLAMEAFLAKCASVPGLAAALAVARRLPPAVYDAADWAFVSALLQLLPRAAARLRLVFARERAIDFADATLAALDALDDADSPSDLLLAMDMRISHLLVDEFQDTSIAQCELIGRLTTGWDAGDGRTLFLVGDPMQSIYRFREADVGLFLAAKRDGRLGNVALQALTLSRNFRSRPELVAWTNRVYQQVLPGEDDLARGDVAFKGADATRAPDARAMVTLDVCADAADEAEAVVAHVEAALRDGFGSIAMLVRKRSDLDTLLPLMRTRGIDFSAVGLDRLTERPALLDLLSLTHALLQPEDRLAWLSVLRAPWCGLSLPDLFAAVEVTPNVATFLDRAARREPMQGLTADGEARLARIADALAPTWAQRGRVPLASWIRRAWLALGGPACVDESIDLNASEHYFALLAEHSRGADVPHWHDFIETLGALHVEPETGAVARVQVMTLHRAKGLEFDVVVMPALARGPGRGDAPLLLWRRQAQGLLLAPLKARTTEPGDAALYAYLKDLAAADARAELGRLLYVGCTRARERLHLSAVLSVDEKEPANRRWKRPTQNTSLALLWPAIADQAVPPMTTGPSIGDQRVSGVPLLRLASEWRLPVPPPTVPVRMRGADAATTEPIVFDWVRESARQVGSVAHALLRQIADEGLANWNAERVHAQRARAERECIELGFSGDEARIAAGNVVQGVAATLDDPRGRWLLDPTHTDSSSELALTGVIDRQFVRVVLDRTFVDAAGTRWIVDFKLSQHEGADSAAFLDGERERYREQLERYARVMRGLDTRPIRLGLYFPLLGGWREWPASS